MLLVKTVKGNVIYTPSVQRFNGTVDMGNVTSGNYIIKLKVKRYLVRRIPGILVLPGANSFTVPEFLTCDINGDNTCNIADYNLFVGCYGDKASTAACGASKEASDLNDDSTIDLTDYRWFVKNITLRQGE